MIIEDANFPNNEIRIVVSPTQTKRLAEPTRPTTEPTICAFGVPSVRSHHVDPGQRLQRSNEDTGSDANRLTHHIRQVVDPVGKVYLESPGWTEQCLGAVSQSREAVTRWLLLIVCLHLDDATA